MAIDKFSTHILIDVQSASYLVRRINTHNPVHVVDKNKICSCGDRNCWAILAVAEYLHKGGQRASSHMPPCPICGSPTIRDPKWDGKFTKRLGWQCSTGGVGHFLEAKFSRIRTQWAKNPWLIPPVPGYPGVRREELMTWQECDPADYQQNQMTEMQVTLDFQ